MSQAHDPNSPRYALPPLGGNPSSQAQGTTPGSFANPAELGGAYAFSSPDTPGMPAPSSKTAWDFMPHDWRRIEDANGVRFEPPEGFTPITQLEHARLGTVTPEMRRVAEREPHLTPEQVRDEVAAGRWLPFLDVLRRARRTEAVPGGGLPGLFFAFFVMFLDGFGGRPPGAPVVRITRKGTP